MKRFICIVLTVWILLTICSCSAAVETTTCPDSETAVTFTDDLGRTVTVDAPQRVAPLLGSFAQVWLLAGGKVCATADDAWEDLNLELDADTVNLGNTKQLSLEALLGCQPEFIIASTNTRQHIEWLDTLEATGIPVAYFDISCVEDYLRLLKICTDITGREDLYRRYGDEVEEDISDVILASRVRLANMPAPTVLCLVASAGGVYAKNSENNVLGEMLYDLGCVNIADSDSMLLENLNIEHIVQADPEYIFFVQRGDDEEGMRAYVNELLMEHPAWAQLSAVQNGRVYFMDKELFNLKPNHRWPEAYKILEEILSNG